MNKKKVQMVLFFGLVVGLWSIWEGGKPIRCSLASKSSQYMQPWRLNKEQATRYGALANIHFNIPEHHSVEIDRQEDFATYQILNPDGKLLLMLYFGNHPDWPPKTHWADWRGNISIGGLKCEVVSFWSFFAVSKEVWLCRSSSGWGVQARYSRLSKRNAAIADKIIDSIQPPMRPGE